MERMLISILNMGFAASGTALVVMVLRRLLKKLPRGYVYGLWLVVLFRFLCPVTFAAPMSLLPVNPTPIQQEIVYDEKPEIQTGVLWVDRAVNDTVMEALIPEDAAQSVNPIQIVLAAGAVIWAIGVLGLALYYLLSYIRLKKKTSTAVRADAIMAEGMSGEGGSVSREGAYRKIPIYVLDQFKGAFTMGIFRPVIYLPGNLGDREARMILEHELVHIRRKDSLVKGLWLAAVVLHWFQPMAWLSFRMMCMDMEMSCDEQVLKERGRREKAWYSELLLREAEEGRLGLHPLAFGKPPVYQRIRRILSYHRPGKLARAAGGMILAGAAIGLIVNPGKGEVESPLHPDMETNTSETPVTIIGGADGPTSIFIAGKLEGEESQGEGEVIRQESPDADWLASVELDWDGRNSLILDVAGEDMLIFHGDFGLFAFGKDSYGRWKQQMFLSDQESSKIFLEGLKASGVLEDGGSLGREDRLIGKGGASFRALDFDAVKRRDGTVAVLGAAEEDVGKGHLINLWYGYYDPKEQVMTQAYLFLGDGKETVNGEGQVGECRYLFSREGCPYYLRTPRQLLPFEEGMFAGSGGTGQGEEQNYQLPYGRLALMRDKDGKEELLDDLVCANAREQQKVVLTEERLVYTAAFEKSGVSVKTPGLVSILYDGTDRRTSDIPYQVYNGLSYDDGWLYFEGWTNDQTFPRPLIRVKPDFTQQEKLGELEGSLIAVRDQGICWEMDWEEGRVMTEDVRRLGEGWVALEETEKGREQSYELQEMENGQLKVTVWPSGEVYYIPLYFSSHT